MSAACSFLVMQYLTSHLSNVLDAYPITLSCPSCSCCSTAPAAQLLASTSNTNSPFSVLMASIGPVTRLFFNLSNASCLASVQTKDSSFLVNSCSGAANNENFFTNFL